MPMARCRASQDKGVSVRLTQADEPLLEAAQRMLLRLGIASHDLPRAPRRAAARCLPDGQGGRRDIRRRPLHELVISGDNLAAFADRVGFDDTAKAARLEALLASYRRSLNRERFTATVEAIEADGARRSTTSPSPTCTPSTPTACSSTTAASNRCPPTAAAASARST